MEKDINNNLSVKRVPEQALSGPIRFFSNDSEFVFFFNKAEKLISALYLITGFFQDSEPMKWKLRELGSELLSTSLLIRDGASADKDRAIVGVREKVLEITSLLAVSKNAGMVSDMNFNIINGQFSYLLDAVSLPSDAFLKGTGDLNQSFFEVERELKEATSMGQNSVVENVYKEQSDQSTRIEESRDDQSQEGRGDKVEVKGAREERNHNQGQSVVSTGLLDDFEDAHTRALNNLKGQNIREHLSTHRAPEPKRSSTNDLKEYGAVAVKKNSRQSIIINLLKRKKEIMIKDVSPLIDGCSEKTIQRELLAMVGQGILRKEGEKRWSRYSLVKP